MLMHNETRLTHLANEFCVKFICSGWTERALIISLQDWSHGIYTFFRKYPPCVESSKLNATSANLILIVRIAHS